LRQLDGQGLDSDGISVEVDCGLSRFGRLAGDRSVRQRDAGRSLRPGGQSGQVYFTRQIAGDQLLSAGRSGRQSGGGDDGVQVDPLEGVVSSAFSTRT
jgi:hypothetical protein